MFKIISHQNFFQDDDGIKFLLRQLISGKIAIMHMEKPNEFKNAAYFYLLFYCFTDHYQMLCENMYVLCNINYVT